MDDKNSKERKIPNSSKWLFDQKECEFVQKNVEKYIDIETIINNANFIISPTTSSSSSSSSATTTTKSVIAKEIDALQTPIIVKFKTVSRPSVDNGYICLQCFDISNKKISCICILPKVEYLNGMWLFKEYSLRYYSPCAQQPYCKNPKCKVKQIPYLQFHDSGIQLMINKLNKEYENDGNNSNSQNMDNSIDVDINDGNTNFVENHQKNNSPAQLSKRQRITLENGFKANPNEYDNKQIIKKSKKMEVPKNCKKLKFILKAVTPLITTKSRQKKIKKKRRKTTNVNLNKEMNTAIPKHIFLIVQGINDEDYDMYDSVIIEDEKFIELKGKYAVDWYPFLHIDNVYEITNLSKASLSINSIEQEIYVPYSYLKCKMLKSEKLSNQNSTPNLHVSTMKTIHVNINIPFSQLNHGNVKSTELCTEEENHNEAENIIQHLRNVVNYHGIVTKRLHHDVYELDHKFLLLLSFSGESCTNGGVAIVPNAELYLKNVHYIYGKTNMAKIGFATCAVSQIQILKFSSRNLYPPRNEVQGHCLKNNRNKFHFVHFCRRYNFNTKELLWVNRTLHKFQQKFMLPRSCKGMDYIVKLCDELLGSINIFPKSDLSKINNNANIAKQMCDGSEMVRATTSRNLYLEFLFHDKCCNRNLDFMIPFSELYDDTCDDVLFNARNFNSLPITLTIKEVININIGRNINADSNDNNSFPKTFIAHSSKIYKNDSIALLVWFNGCNCSGKLIIQDETGELPVVFTNDNTSTDLTFFNVLLKAFHKGYNTTTPAFSNEEPETTTKTIFKLNSFCIVDEYYNVSKNRSHDRHRRRRCHRRYIQICKNDFDLSFMSSYQLVSSPSLPTMECNNVSGITVPVKITNISHVTLIPDIKNGYYLNFRMEGYVLTRVCDNNQNCIWNKNSKIVVESGKLIYNSKKTGSVDTKRPVWISFYENGFPPSLALILAMYPKYDQYYIKIHDVKQIVANNLTNTNIKASISRVYLHSDSIIFPIIAPIISPIIVSTKGNLEDTSSMDNSKTMSVTECLSLCAAAGNSNKLNINIIGRVSDKKTELSQSNNRNGIQNRMLPQNSKQDIRNLLGTGDFGNKLKLTVQDVHTMDQIDFYFDCHRFILPDGLHIGSLIEIKHLFLRINNLSGKTYLAEQSFNAKKGTKSTHVSLLKSSLSHSQSKIVNKKVTSSENVLTYTQFGSISKLSKLNSFIMMKFHIFIRQVLYVSLRPRISNINNYQSWECSVLGDDGTGEAKIFFDGANVLKILNIDKKKQLEIEKIAIQSKRCFEYSIARDTLNGGDSQYSKVPSSTIINAATTTTTNSIATNSNVLLKGNKFAELSTNFNELIITSFKPCHKILLCKERRGNHFNNSQQQNISSMNLYINDQPIESKRMLPKRLKCHHIYSMSKDGSRNEDTVQYRLEAYRNLKIGRS